MTKLFSNPSFIINSNLNRFGDPNMRTVDDLEATEDKKESEEAAKIEATPNTEDIGVSKLRTWNLNIKKRFQITNGECLIDSTYKCKSDLTVDRNDYNATLSKHYMLDQLLRFFGLLSALDIAKKLEKGDITNYPVGIDPIDLKKEAAGILFRSSQLGSKRIFREACP